MRKLYQRQILTERNEYLKNDNSKIITGNANKQKENPIRLLNKKVINTNLEKYNSTNYSSFSNNKNTSLNKHKLLNKRIKNLSESDLNMKTANNFLPLISHTEPNNEIKINKKKLEDIINMFKKDPKNNSFLQKKYKFKHRGLVPTIPNDILSRLKYNYNIFKNTKFIEYVKHAPPKNKYDLEEITDYLWNYSKDHSKIVKFYAIFFYYLCINIQYDVDSINEKENNINKLFKSGYANSLQFCKLYEFMCKRHFLRINRIEGFCKSKVLPKYKKGTDVTQSNHFWNSIYINNSWYFVDLTFGSGGLKLKTESEKANINSYFNPYYFLTPPECLIITHRPLNDIWQMTEKIIQVNEFSNKSDVHMGDFYKQVYEHNINLISHKFPVIICKNKELNLKLSVNNIGTQAFLYFSNYKTKSTELKTEYDNEIHATIIEHKFDMNGEYWLEIFYREDNSTEIEYLPLINYKIIVKNSEEKYIEKLKKRRKIKLDENFLFDLKWKKNKNIKKKNYSRVLIDHDQINFYSNQTKICLDNEGAYLISPNSKNIKIGQINEFKVKVPNTDVVCVLDGHDWNYLKRNRNDKNIWMGNIEIKNENVMILSLKENKVFTEIFRLKAHYVTSNLLRLSQQKKDKAKSVNKKLKSSFKY